MNKDNKAPVIEGVHQDKRLTIVPIVTLGTTAVIEKELGYAMEMVYQSLKNGDVGVKIEILSLMLISGDIKYPDGAPTNSGDEIKLDIETTKNIVISMPVREASKLCEWLAEEIRQVNPQFFDKMDEAWEKLNKRFTEGDFAIAPDGTIDTGETPNPNLPPESETG